MPITAIDPKTALILVDLQNGIVSLPLAHPVAEVLANARLLADGFRSRNLPVVLVNVAGGAPGRVEQSRSLAGRPPEWFELVPGLGRHPNDHAVTKRTWGAFTGTELADHLAALGVTQVVIAGISTSIGVESTARQAQELGFNVAIAFDATTDMNLDAYTNSLTRIFPRLGETDTTERILEFLEERRA